MIRYTLNLVDTAGMEGNDALPQSFFRGVDIAIFMLSSKDNENTIKIFEKWITQFDNLEKSGIVIVYNYIQNIGGNAVKSIDQLKQIIKAQGLKNDISEVKINLDGKVEGVEVEGVATPFQKGCEALWQRTEGKNENAFLHTLDLNIEEQKPKTTCCGK